MRKLFPKGCVTLLVMLSVAACVTTVARSFNTDLLPDFEEEGVIAGREIPLEPMDQWVQENAEELASKDPKIAQKQWALFWLEESEVILARTWWNEGDFKANYSDFMVINLATGETIVPGDEATTAMTEMVEEIVERRPIDSGEDTAKTVVLTALSFLAGSGQVHHFQSFEGTVRSLTRGKELDYGIKIYNQFSKVTFTTEEEDVYEHQIHVPRSEMYLAPDGNFVFFPYGYLVQVTKPDAGINVWTGYANMITSSPDPGWQRLGIVEKNDEGNHVLRVVRFNLPEEIE